MKRAAKAQGLRIRRGTARDIPTIASLIRALAKYERLTPYLRFSTKRLRKHGFGGRKYFEALMCERGKTVIGYAIYYLTYSSFACRPVLFIEDIFVLPEERGHGAGRALMVALARVAMRKGCEQMEWIVLDWNTPSIKFYERLGASLDKTWVLTRLTGARMRRLSKLRWEAGRGRRRETG
jgi:GNAT superfamily N-acetyltransferase